jgi:hypothetical protein
MYGQGSSFSQAERSTHAVARVLEATCILDREIYEQSSCVNLLTALSIVVQRDRF